MVGVTMVLFLFSAVLGAPAIWAEPPILDTAVDLHLDGELKAARQAYSDALQQSLNPEQEAQAHNNLCVLLPDLGDSKAAVEHCQRATELRRASGDTVRLARALNNLGIALLYSGHARDAGVALAEALKLNDRENEPAAKADNLTHLGLVAEAEGRLSDALDLHRRSRDLAEAQSELPWASARRQTAVINLGVTLEKLGQHRQALMLYRELLDGPSLAARKRARLWVNTAALYRNLEDPERALQALLEAEDLFSRQGDLTGRVDVHLIRGQVHHQNLRQAGAAEKAFQEALDSSRNAGDTYGETQALFLLGDLLRESSETLRAREFFLACLTATTEEGRPEARWSAHGGLAELYLHEGDLATAWQHAQRAMAVVETVRSQVRTPELRGSFFQDRRTIYSTAIEVLRQLGSSTILEGGPEDAWRVVQRAKERELLAALQARDEGVEQSVFDTNSFLLRLGDRGFADYWLDGDQLYVWVLPPTVGGHKDLTRMELTRLEGAEHLSRAVTDAHRSLSSGKAVQAKDLLDLGRALLQPLDVRPDSQWLLVPDGRLRYLPFEILPLPSDPDSRLIDVADVVYLPSASTLAELDRTIQQPRSHDFVGLGDSVLSAASRAWLGQGANLRRLPAAAEELESAARRLGGPFSLAMGEEATEDNLRHRLAEGTAILHLATHAVVEERPGRGAALLLSSPAGEQPSARDGLLRPPEIVALGGDPDLTVLAACRSAVSDDGDVGALGSLTGAFIASGSRGVVAGLWPVGDRTSAIIMDQFYERLERGMTPSAALSDVKRRLRADPRWNQSHLWAAWVLWGDPPAPRFSPRPWLRSRWLGFSVVLGLIAASWAMVRRRHQA